MVFERRGARRQAGPRIEILPPELRQLVGRSVALLGEVIDRRCGREAFDTIEALRREMVALRDLPETQTAEVSERLEKVLSQLTRAPRERRWQIARSFSVMLELINACENAYRTFRLQQTRDARKLTQVPNALIYVITSHPTEARSPENVQVFHWIQNVLTTVLNEEKGGSRIDPWDRRREEILHLLEIAWAIPVARNTKPRVEDEAEYLFSILLREETLKTLLRASSDIAPVYLRTWVGGDKDGHPGVDERSLIQSWKASRLRLLRFVRRELEEVARTLSLWPADEEVDSLKEELVSLQKDLVPLSDIRAGDGRKLSEFRGRFRQWSQRYSDLIGAPHPGLKSLWRLLHLFPGLVVPVELRDAADEMHAGSQIARMIATLGKIARGADVKWYARGLIISMASSFENVRAAMRLARSQLDPLKASALPIIPLFEQREALEKSPGIVRQMARDADFRNAIQTHWGGFLEVMLGYSDSAKEMGVLPSRVLISKTLVELDRICSQEDVVPIFFHGAGGSIDRGGGSIEEQTAGWPRSVLRWFKTTIQGEMVERSFASPEIMFSALRKTAGQYATTEAEPREAAFHPVVNSFIDRVRQAYEEKTHSPDFLRLVERATLYRYVSELKIGSRPAKRSSGALDLKSLRAIPWVLCWTQSRVLFPTWWGIGTAWRTADPFARKTLIAEFREHPVLSSFTKLLGFTLAKVELPIWRLYLERAKLSDDQTLQWMRQFELEMNGAMGFATAVSGTNDLLWYRPWLGESIRMRSPMIHPLNLIQILSLEEGAEDLEIFRETVTGISAGMMTTG